MRIGQARLGAVIMGVAALLALAFYERYWLWRDCFNELGRCFDPDTQDVYLQQSGIASGTLSALFLILGLGLVLRALRDLNRH